MTLNPSLRPWRNLATRLPTAAARDDDGRVSAQQVVAEVDVVETYVASLAGALRGPRRAKGDLLREARDHLIDATEALQGQGLEPRAAQRRAVSEFGAVEDVAPGYQAVLSSGSSRRIGLGLLVVTAAQPVAWDLAVGPDEPAGMLGAVLGVGVEVVGIACLVAAPLVAALGGIGLRRLGIRTRLVRAGALTTLVLSLLIALQAVAMVSVSSGPLLTGLGIASGLALVPYGAVALASVRCLRDLGRAQDLGGTRLRS